eukprot:764298-Hanusia_phi.AAC.2
MPASSFAGQSCDGMGSGVDECPTAGKGDVSGWMVDEGASCVAIGRRRGVGVVVMRPCWRDDCGCELVMERRAETLQVKLAEHVGMPRSRAANEGHES